jgi:glutamate-1-semialdehyde 2,1-aminomutase
VLAQLDDASYASLEQTAERLAAGLRDAFLNARVAAQVTRAHTLVGFFFTADPVTDYDGARKADHERYARMFHSLLDRNVYFAPSGYETLFPSLAHTDAEIDETIAAVVASLL